MSFESNAGEVFVTLRLGLGEHPSKVCDGNDGPKMKKRLSPSKIRRRDRRAAERLLAQSSSPADIIEEMVAVTEASKCDSMENVVHVNEVITEKVVEQCVESEDSNSEMTKDIVETCKSIKPEYRCVKDQVSVEDRPIVKKTSLWAQAHSDRGAIKSGQRDFDVDKRPVTLSQL